MKLELPTASRLDDAVACPASCVLPHEKTETGEAALRGNVAHKFLEDVGSGKSHYGAYIDAPPEYRDWLIAIDTTALFDGLTDIQVEIPYAVDVTTETVRRLVGGHRAYAGRKDTEFVGTVDVVAKRNGRPVVRDYKTGSNLGDPTHKMQLKFAALAVHLETGFEDIDAEFVYIREDGSYTVESTTFGLIDHTDAMMTLGMLRERIIDAFAEVSAGRLPTVNTGSHCRFCPAYMACPAKFGMLKQAIGLDDMDMSDVASVWRAYEAAKIAVDRLKPILNEHIERYGIELDDRTVVKMFTSSKRAMGVGRLTTLARNLGATPQDIERCWTTTSFSYPKPHRR